MGVSIPTIFAAGLLTFVSPCVLPLVPIYLATLADGSLQSARPRRLLLVAAAFSLGLATVFVALGALASSFGALLVAQRTAITLASGALMLVFGVRALGLLRSSALDRDVRPGLTRVRAVSTLAGAFVFGAAFALGWSPCIGPVLAAVLAYAATHADSPLRGALYLAVYAAGLASPLLLLAAGAGHAAGWLKRARGAVVWFEKLTGVALVVMGAFMLWGASSLGLAADQGSAVAALHPAAGGGKPACETASDKDHTCALPKVRADSAGEVALPAGGAQLLEFTSHECPVCRRMRPIVERLLAACTQLDAHVVLVDVSTASGRALADRHHVQGTPTYLFLDEHGVERARLLGENSSEALAAAVERAFGLSCWG